MQSRYINKNLKGLLSKGWERFGEAGRDGACEPCSGREPSEPLDLKTQGVASEIERGEFYGQDKLKGSAASPQGLCQEQARRTNGLTLPQFLLSPSGATHWPNLRGSQRAGVLVFKSCSNKV